MNRSLLKEVAYGRSLFGSSHHLFGPTQIAKFSIINKMGFPDWCNTTVQRPRAMATLKKSFGEQVEVCG